MLTNKRKQRDRKQFFSKLGIVAVLFVLGVGAGYLVSLNLFAKSTYKSPLAQEVMAEVTHQDEEALELIRSVLVKEEKKPKSISRLRNTYKIILENNAEVVLSSQKDLKTQLSSLQFILRRLTMEDRRFTRLDLSFDKPIIVLEK